MSESSFLDHVGLDMHGHRKKTGFFLEALDRHRARLGRERGDVRVLELGCGNGHVVALPLAEQGFDVTGVDFHPPSIAAANAANPFPHARFLVGDVFDADGATLYDGVILSDVLEHVDDPGALLRSTAAALADDGLLLISIPNGFGPYEAEQWLERHGLLRPFLWLIRAVGRLARRGRRPSAPSTPDDALAYNAESGHVQFFTLRRFLGLLDAAGLDVVERRNGSLLGGELSSYAFRAAPRLVPLSLRAADRLPPALVSTWYFACVKRPARSDG
ncbi:MAG: class I SAM-dependent methyltransferase [Gaiellaceae bacterium]